HAYQNFLVNLANKLPHLLCLIIKPVLKTGGLTYTKIAEEEFYNILIEPKDSVNWQWRKPHLDIITAHGKHTYTGEIIRYLKENQMMAKLLAQTRETDTSKPFVEPISANKEFWQSGNNYFIYCIKYQFLAGVIPYKAANQYIATQKV